MRLILFTAGEDAYGSFSADSSHHRFNRYRLVDNSGDEHAGPTGGSEPA